MNATVRVASQFDTSPTGFIRTMKPNWKCSQSMASLRSDRPLRCRRPVTNASVPTAISLQSPAGLNFARNIQRNDVLHPRERPPRILDH